MLTVRAIIKNGNVEFIDKVSVNDEQKVLITFLDANVIANVFSEHSQKEVVKIVSNFRIGLADREMTVLKFAQEGLTSEKIA